MVTADGIVEFPVKPNGCRHYQDEAQTGTFVCGTKRTQRNVAALL